MLHVAVEELVRRGTVNRRYRRVIPWSNSIKAGANQAPNSMKAHIYAEYACRNSTQDIEP